MTFAGELGIPVIERRITRDEVYIADEAFFTGTAAEVTPIREFDNRPIGEGRRGPITDEAADDVLRHGQRPQSGARGMADAGEWSMGAVAVDVDAGDVRHARKICRCSARIRRCRCGARIRACSSTSRRRRGDVPVLRHALSRSKANRKRATEQRSLRPGGARRLRAFVRGSHAGGRAIVGRRRDPVRAADRACGAQPSSSRVDVLAPPWCAPVYARMRGIRRIIDNPARPRQLALHARTRSAYRCAPTVTRTRFVLPNSWKSALVPCFARIPARIGYVGEARYGLLTEARRLDRKAMPQLVDALRGARERAAAPFPMHAAAAPRAEPATTAPPRCARCGFPASGRSRSCVPARSSDRPSAGRPSTSRRSARGSPTMVTRYGFSARRTTRCRGSACRRAAVAGASRRRSHRPHRSRHGDRSPVRRLTRRQQRLRA